MVKTLLLLLLLVVVVLLVLDLVAYGHGDEAGFLAI
jgi:hypothetical protein